MSLVDQSYSRQSGVALLQVLLISAVISVLAIRFSQTAQDQVEMADAFDQRIRAQMAARSIFNEIVLVKVSTFVTPLVADSEVAFGDMVKLNPYGEAILWRDGITVSTQDLNGLLPRLYPRYFLWRTILKQLEVDAEDIDRYLGVWKDLQDTDADSWIGGEQEPEVLSGGARFPNRLGQTKTLIKLAFMDRPNLADKVLSYSSYYPTPEMNLFNMPADLLNSMFDSSLADNIQRVRADRALSIAERVSILPLEYRDDRLTLMNSSAMKITISVPLLHGRWRQSWSVRLAPGRVKPFHQIPN
ncbi:MAG: Uncharacterised protein [Porticoccaceae bacterium UBA1117]|nr:MAG: Uncharacterised protein [Porticoccaceae bacterium UBA1117]